MSSPRKPSTRRKAPVQARSITTVAVLHTAAIQVLTREGLARCTTTRIARRAGVSVGTVYQYYPNCDALLAAVLEKHLEGFSASIISACKLAQGLPVTDMVRHLVATLVTLKMHDPQEAAALYAVAGEKTGKNIALTVHKIMLPAIVAMLETAPDVAFDDPALTSEVFLSIFLGMPRTMLEGYGSDQFAQHLAAQLEAALLAYLRAASSR